MELAIAERLVCPHPHQETPLVVRADQVDGGELVRGVAGCPVCLVEWPIDRGALDIGNPARFERTGAAPDTAALAAFLSLMEPGLIVIADGVPVEAAGLLRDEFGARVIVLDATLPFRAAAVINGATRIPLAAGLAAGAAFLRAGRDDGFLESAVRVVRPGGRVVALNGVREPDAVRVIARDAHVWVGERESAAAPIPLRRRDA
jgi:hypothetical protein